MQRRFPAWILGAIVAVVTTPAMAIDMYGHWWTSVMISGVDEDKDRGLETEWSGYHFGVGRGLGSDWGVEFNLVGTRLDNRAGDRALLQWGLGVDLTRRLFDSRQFSPYGLMGLGWLTSDYKLNREDEDDLMASIGIGVMVPTPIEPLRLRTELRARRDFTDGYMDYLFSIGVKIPFSFVNLGQPEARPRADGTRPAQEEPYGWSRDSDGDGVANAADLCPATPAGLTVNAQGCAAVEDRDGDGVPNAVDMCPDTPPGAAVDRHGCRLTLPSGPEGGR